MNNQPVHKHFTFLHSNDIHGDFQAEAAEGKNPQNDNERFCKGARDSKHSVQLLNAPAKELLTDEFDVDPDFDWSHPLAKLNPKFELLSYLADLENALNNKMKRKVRLVGKINLLIHSAEDLLRELSAA